MYFCARKKYSTATCFKQVALKRRLTVLHYQREPVSWTIREP